jgi:8-oxo-dGTP pyrophosphatase MutT (NUDIX family)
VRYALRVEVQAFSELRAQILDNLRRFERRPLPSGGRRRAAVALVIGAAESGEACFVLTRRASTLPSHAGQWALPGGRCDTGEDVIDTAIRETHEEVGLSLHADAALGLLDDYATRSGYLITPVVLWHGDRFTFAPDPREVAAVYEVPIAELRHPRVPELQRIPESDRPIISVPLPSVNSDIHAPTAAILYQLREVALAGRSTRVAHYEQPVFAWR